MEGVPHTARVTALTEVQVCFVGRDRILEVLPAAPRLALGIIRFLARETRTFKDIMMALTQRPVRRRVADVLLLLHGHTVEGDDWVPLPSVRLKRKEIAQMVGATPESVSRTLAEMAEQGLIRMTRTELEIVDSAGLQAAARATDRD
jgi:CRP-like cAMP-binding protein